MKIPNFDATGLAVRILAVSPETGQSPHMAWRRALEQAQWEQRVRYQPTPQFDAGADHRPAGGESPSGYSFRAQALVPPAANNTVFDGVAESASGASAQFTRVDATVLRPAARPVENAQARWVSVAIAAASAPPQTSARAYDGARNAAARAASDVLSARPHWMPSALVIHMQGRQVRATLRDANLDTQQAARLFRDLRAHLSDAGMQLLELIVNGHPVQPDVHGLPAHKGREHGS